MLYDAYEVQRSWLAGASRAASFGSGWLNNPANPLSYGSMGPLVAASLEMRVPLLGVLSREIRYGPVPIDAFVFSDGGLVWTRSSVQSSGVRGRSFISSVGAGVRLGAFGLPLELAAVRG